MRRPLSLLAALLALSLPLAACSKDDQPDATPSSGDPTIDAGGSFSTTWPLTGLEATDGEDVEQTHPPLVVKMDNTASASPQIGLSQADLVVEELVEGGLTRLAVFYYSQLPTEVGPVRSMRASDIGIVSPVDASVVTSGAAARTIVRIQGAGITFYQEGAAGIYREPTRAAPYNVMADLTQIAKTAKAKAARPADYLAWGSADDLPKGRKAGTIGATFGGGRTSTWVFRDGGYVNTNSYAAAGDQFPADTVLVLRVEVGDAGYRDPAGNPVPETKLVGTGPALLFHGGRLVRGTWSKDALDGELTLSTKKGDLPVPAGHTWIELIPQVTGNVAWQKSARQN